MNDELIGKIHHFVRETFRDFSRDIWTHAGMFSTWLVLTGSAKRVIGDVYVIGALVWIFSAHVRRDCLCKKCHIAAELE